jgi:diacylglycerol kinase
MNRGNSISRALGGIAHAFRKRLSLRLHLSVAFAVVIAGGYFGLSSIEWCIITVCIGAVLSAELFNLSLERRLTETGPENFSEESGSLDIAAGAVLVVCLSTALIGCIVFIPYFTERFL